MTYQPFGDEWKAEVMKLKKAEIVDMLAEGLQHESNLQEALQAIIEIGKRDLSNEKYDVYFENARAAIAKPQVNNDHCSVRPDCAWLDVPVRATEKQGTGISYNAETR